MKFRMASALLFSLVSVYAQAGCEQLFFEGKAPVVSNPKLLNKSRALCYTEFAVLHSGLTRTPLYSAEYLTPQAVQQARGLRRESAFHAEDLLPADERAELRDYARSGRDRGHQFPSGDAGSSQAQYESFTLANMIPQDPNNNRSLWEGVESSVRQYVSTHGPVYVITGPLFEGRTLQRIGGRVMVPTSIFKAIYDPQRHQGAAYVTPNAPGMDWQAVPLAEVERRAGVVLFPSLPMSIKSRAMSLPAPKPHGYAKNGGQSDRPAAPYYTQAKSWERTLNSLGKLIRN